MSPLFWIKAAVILACTALGFASAWYVRGLQMDAAIAALKNGELKTLNAQEQTAIDKQGDALNAARDYEKLKDALRPQIIKVKSDAAPIIIALDKCYLPADAARVLDTAADLADRRAIMQGASP